MSDRNRFNNITSKEWLPFQKSWFIHTGDEALYGGNLRFFMRLDDSLPRNMFFVGDKDAHPTIQKVAKAHGVNVFFQTEALQGQSVQLILIDIRNRTEGIGLPEYKKVKADILTMLEDILPNLLEKRFVAVLHKNTVHQQQYYPYVWDLTKHLATGLAAKDEKIGCVEEDPHNEAIIFHNQVFYASYFRKEADSSCRFSPPDINFFQRLTPTPQHPNTPIPQHPNWSILRPKRRKKNEILHPAKFPEELARFFIQIFSRQGDNVFDPMSGTASTQVAAIQEGRNGYGTELSTFFAELANQRLTEAQELAVEQGVTDVGKFNIKNKDARRITKKDFPEIDYVFTSPPYWDMLNMKGAENQAARKKKGLQLNYSDDTNDLGNLGDYQDFLDELVAIYFGLYELMKPGAYMTIVVKNIKKKGQRFTLAYDLGVRLQERFRLLPEYFWMQDDLRLAPYGYGYTWVSNTFHQYCLTFQK